MFDLGNCEEGDCRMQKKLCRFLSFYRILGETIIVLAILNYFTDNAISDPLMEFAAYLAGGLAV